MKRPLSQINIEEHLILGLNTLEILKQDSFDSVIANYEVVKDLEKLLKQFEQAYDKQRFSGKGVNVQKLDNLRKQLYTTLKQQIAIQAKIEGATNQAIAIELDKFVKKEKVSLNQLNYAEKTAKIDQFIRELGQVDMQSKLNLLHLTENFNLLKTAQTNFIETYELQNKLNAKLRELPSATELKSQLNKLLRIIFDYVEIMKEKPVWKDLHFQLVELQKSTSKSKHEKSKEKEKEKKEEKVKDEKIENPTALPKPEHLTE